MFEITTSWIGPFIIALGIALRPYILKRLDKKGAFANILFIVVLFLIVLPFYRWTYKFTLVSMNDNSAKELALKALEFKMFDGYKLESIQWKPYNSKKNLYNIKASIYDKKYNSYYMYLQPTCKFFKGCQIQLNKMIIIDPNIKNIHLKDMNERMFTQRECSDVVVQNIVLEKNVKPFFKALFAKWSSLKNSKALYRIDKLSLGDFKHTKIMIKNIQDNQDKLSNSCKANLYIKGDFDIKFKNKGITKVILDSMFDKVTFHNGYYEIKTNIYYNIYANKDAGAISVNSLFIDLKKMKKVAKSIVSKMKSRKNDIKQNNCSFKQHFPKNMVVYATGAYGGKRTDIQIDQSGHQATKFDIVVNSPKKPIALILASYEPSIWNIKWTKGTHIKAIYVSGYYRQIILGVPKKIPLINSTYKNRGKCGYFYISNKTARKINSISRRIFNRNVTLVYISKRDGKVHLGEKLSPNTKLYSSKERKLSNYIDKTKPLAGEAGLKELVKKGFLRRYTKKELLKWASLQEKLYKKSHNEKTLPKIINGNMKKSFIPSVVLNGYTILKKITIPAGLYGANAATFFLPKGVPFPEGDLGHSTLYDFNTGKCYGVLCGHI